MVTGREVNKISQTLTDGQLAITTPTDIWTADTDSQAPKAEGKSVQEAAPGITRKLVSVYFYGIYARISAYMSSDWPIFRKLIKN